MTKVSLLLLGVALICLQNVALSVRVVEEEGLSMGRSSTIRRFLQSQYSQQNHLSEYSHPHSPSQPSHHQISSKKSDDLSHDKSTSTLAPSCNNNVQCASQTTYGHKKYSKAGCCKGRCVDLLSDDKNNCGSCGRKCSYGAVCCKGQCTHIYGSDYENCGRCGKKCGKGVKCLYGICGYNAGSP